MRRCYLCGGLGLAAQARTAGGLRKLFLCERCLRDLQRVMRNRAARN
jgi:hypothetical protein